jgi:AcrR family transcriptional regulator
MTTIHTADDTRERLIRAAGEEFARRGFYEASVRTICRAAGANISAIKYHFGSKDGLYEQVVSTARGQMCGGAELPLMGEGDDPERALQHWMVWFLDLLLVTESEAHPWMGEILTHEMIRPTRFLDEFAEHTGRPIHHEAVRIIGRILPAGASERELTVLANGLISLCVTQKHCGTMLSRLGSPPPRTPEAVLEMAEILSRFAIQGLRGFTRWDARSDRGEGAAL